ncbi:uncharacterized protein LOC126996015 isoform X2 [Eriocheir sinensis]|uniref:uncharacterized protein LOC126996015 isoform X2 n=1 Tax=Eriocheir sinensis TaxID=95602 RepID=UPI0021CA9546|nr:uncharacterized protein LOC126996015 isoform X2 [Eriocheir sinensis]
MGGGGRGRGGEGSSRRVVLATVMACCIGFGLGDEAGFPFSIKNTKGGQNYYRRKDSTARSSAGEEGEGGGGGGSRLRPSLSLLPPPSGQTSQERSSSIGHPSSERSASIGPPMPTTDGRFVPSSTERGAVIGSSSNARSPAIGPQYTRSQKSGSSSPGGRSWSWWPSRRRSGAPGRQPSSSSSSSFFSRLFSWLPWPFGEGSWFSGGSSRADSRNSHFRVIQEQSDNHLRFNGPQSFGSNSFNSPSNRFNPNSFNSPNNFNPNGFNPYGFDPFQFDPLNPYAPIPSFPQPPPPLPPSSSSGHPLPTVGSAIGDVLKVAPNTPADTDHVPSFAAKMFVVREAPQEYYPPGYKPTEPLQRTPPTVEVPRTKFFCEEQRYLPGLYADTQLGCKVFHMCLPAAVGNTQTSFLCPNMTLFDQSILQCNWWYYVRCEDSPQNYDANLPLAISYRRVNAAQLPLTAVGDYNSLALLDVSARSARNLLKEGDGAVGRMGLAAQSEKEVGEEKNAALAIPNVKENQEKQEQGVKASDDSDKDTPEMRKEEKEVEKEGEKEKDEDVNGKEKQQEVARSPSSEVETENVNKMNVRILRVNKLEEENEEEKVEDIKVDKEINSRVRKRRSVEPIFSNTRHFSSPLLSRLHRRNPMP